METALIGATSRGGIRRLSLTDFDREVRDWFRSACEAAGCMVVIDEVGNMFARRPGRNNALPPVSIGSHLDTQPTGGKFDGILGVLAGLEVIRTLNDLKIETNAPIEVVNWTNEEGSRFAPAMLGSGVFAGVFTRAYADSREDREGRRFGDELERIGYRGTERCGARKFSAHFELHIEQGPILEAEGKTIGVVTGVQGMRWFEVTVTGQESHAGSTPMALRRDAMVTAARMMLAVDEIARRYGPSGVGTVGLVECRPNSRNVIPGSVFFTVDLRHPEDTIINLMEKEMRKLFSEISEFAGTSVVVERIWDSPAVRFDVGCVDAVRRAAVAAGFAWREIVSGPGHDAAYVARVAPTAMIFVPCERGLSHNEEENIKKADAIAGANVLLRAVLDMDERLHEQTNVG